MSTLLTVPEAAAALRVSVETVYRFARAGHLTTVRYASAGPARILIPADAIEAFVTAHTRAANGGAA